MKWTLIAFCVVIVACKHPLTVKDIEPKLQTYFIKNLESVDSSRIIKLKPVTGKDRLMMRINQLSDSARYYVQMTKLENEKASANLRLMKRSGGADSILYNTYQHDFDSAVNSARHFGELAKELIFTQNSLLRSSQKADTVKPVDYEAVCAIQFKRKDGSIKQDTVNVFINPQMEIIPEEDYYAGLYEK